jgi:hypothetical protein
MSNPMYRCSAPVFTHNLKNLSQLLKKAAADGRGRGYDPSVLLSARLAPDMFPLIKRTLAFIRGLKAAQFDGSDTRELVMKTPIGSLTFNGADYLNGWALPNFYFHYSAAYNLLRHNGVELGKLDFLGPVPGMTMTGKIAKMMSAKTTATAKKKR